MMPIIDSSPAHHHHHHGHGHQTFYHQQPIAEPTGKTQLTLILPDGVPSTLTVDTNTPMMDLLVQAASSNKLNPSNYSLVILDSNQHVIHFKPNQTVGQIVENCHLPQLNGSSTISLLPKENSPSTPSSKSKVQPFEITVRLQVNLPDGQKVLLRIDPTLPLYEIKEQICKQRKYVDSNRYTLRLPNRLDHPLLLGLSLAEYKTKELTMIHLKQDQQNDANQIQSFDRLYRARSESQQRQTSPEKLPEEEDQSKDVKQKSVNAQLNKNRSTNQTVSVTSLPERSSKAPGVSYTSLHEYWNDPNFDTQSRNSNLSSSTKKRRAPLAPGRISPSMFIDPTIMVNVQRDSENHHQSHESLTDSQSITKQKRKAPVPPTINTNSSTEAICSASSVVNEEKKLEENQAEINSKPEENQAETSSKPQENQVEKLEKTEEQETIESSPKSTPEEKSSPQVEEETVRSEESTPIYSEVQKKIEPIEIESPYSTVKLTPSSTPSPKKNYNVEEIVQAGIAQPAVSPVEPEKEKKPDGLLKIIHDHQQRSSTIQTEEKPTENISYFRVAKSRFGKFETDNRGFVHSAAPIFVENQPESDAAAVDKNKKPNSSSSTTTTKTTEIFVRPVATTKNISNGKKAYDLLKRYEKEEQDELQTPLTVDTDYLKSENDEKKGPSEKLPTPIQLEVTERTTHISVTVESDRKQMITRVSPIDESNNSSTTILAPKPFGKTVTEYRTVRRVGADGELNTTTTVRTETIPRANEN